MIMRGAAGGKAAPLYSIHAIDLDRPLPDLHVGPASHGIALELFREDVPVGFLMRQIQPGTFVNAREAQEWIASEIEFPGPGDENDPALETRAPSVTIAVCTKDHPQLLLRCLEAIRLLEGAASPLEVLVVDNASEGTQTASICAARPEIRYAREELKGLNFARNRALSEARHEVLAFIDDDAVVDPRWLRGLYRAWRRQPSAGAFTGQVLPLELATHAQVIVEQMGGFRKGFAPIVYGQALASDPLYPCTTIFGNGCNMAFNVATMREVGGFDEALDMGAYLPGGGDLDALYRVVRGGHPLVYEPMMLVRHQHRSDMEGLKRQIRKSWGAGTMAFLTKIRASDPPMEAKARTFIHCWLKDLSRRVLLYKDTPSQPWPLAVHELAGALAGHTGLYRRARRRAAQIRAAADG